MSGGAGDAGPVRIDMERSGGIAGIALRRSLDTASLTADGRARVESALAEVDLEGLAARPPGTAAGADRFSYVLTIEAHGRRHAITLAEPDVPEALRPVLDLVMREGDHTG